MRAPSRALAALLCRRARLFGLAPCLAGRSRRLVLLPVARSRGPGPLSLRLAGIDAPERNQPFSAQSREALVALALDRDQDGVPCEALCR